MEKGLLDMDGVDSRGLEEVELPPPVYECIEYIMSKDYSKLCSLEY